MQMMRTASAPCASLTDGLLSRPCLHPVEPDMRVLKRGSGFVKVFGCRPRRTVPRALAAGVRKPPREETAIWARWPGRVGPRAQLWGFEPWAGRADGQARRGLC